MQIERQKKSCDNTPQITRVTDSFDEKNQCPQVFQVLLFVQERPVAKDQVELLREAVDDVRDDLVNLFR
jgi:hypothetical protein